MHYFESGVTGQLVKLQARPGSACTIEPDAVGPLQVLIGGKELGHYGRVESAEELDAAAERKLAEHAAAKSSSKALIAALQDRERPRTVAEQPHAQLWPPPKKQGPQKMSKRAKRKHQKAAKASGPGSGMMSAESIVDKKHQHTVQGKDKGLCTGANAIADTTSTRCTAGVAQSSAPHKVPSSS